MSGLKHILIHQISTSFPQMFEKIRDPNIKEFAFLMVISVEWSSRLSVPLRSYMGQLCY